MICEEYAKTYCGEDLSLIENYELAINDTTQMWECHHRGEILPCGRFSADDLNKFGLYYKRPAAELIFLTPSAHRQLHLKGVPNIKLSKKILQFTKSGEFLREWTSMSEASRQLKINHGNICSCCIGKYKSAGGYVWKYAEDLSDMLESLFEHYRDATTPDGVVFLTAKTNNAGVRTVCKI